MALPIEEIEANVNRLNRTLWVAGGVTGIVAIGLATYAASTNHPSCAETH